MKTLFLVMIAGLTVGCSSEPKTNNGTDMGIECSDTPVTCPVDSFPSQCDPERVESCFVVGDPSCGDTITCLQDTGDCNAEQVQCPDGYEEADCNPGEGTCVDSLEGVCLAAASCDCTACFASFEVASCDGYDDCDTFLSCGEDLNCARCPDWTCGDRENPDSFCPTGKTCREEMCPSAMELIYQCIPSFECPEVPDCPAGMVECQIASATCVMTKTCGTTLLCEAN